MLNGAGPVCGPASASALPDSERDRVRACADGLLSRLLITVPSCRFVSLSTLDGRSAAVAGALTAAGAPRVAAMTSSFLALSETLAWETTSGRSSYVTLASSDGVIVIARVPTRLPAYALSACADDDRVLALLLRRTLDTVAALAQQLDRR
ncbi:hypothetical protein [Tahibacter caeni]|uniref:hypothetical protein n=1 Tax=Tahibacter caeni TaxID=1453545 RepID=UPI002148E7BA|nr:hypothetical protein [Tahibacter caeni]